MKRIFTLCLFLCISFSFSQENLSYQKPHQNILELAEAPLAPSIRMDSKGDNIVFLFRSNYKTIEELSETEEDEDEEEETEDELLETLEEELSS